MANRAAILQVGPANTTVPIWETDGGLAHRRTDRQRQHPLHLVLGRSPQRPAGAGSAAQGARADRRHVVPLGGRHRLYRAGSAARAANTCCCRPATRAMCRRAITSSARRPSAFGPSGAASWSMAARSRAWIIVKKSTKIYPLVPGRQPAGAELRQHVRQAVQHGRPRPTSRSGNMLNQAVQEEPTEAVDATTLGFWASVGIQKGKPFAPDARMKKILTEAAAVGDATGTGHRSTGTARRRRYSSTTGNWKRPFIGGYKFEWQPGVANLTGSAMYFFAATGVTPAMDTQIVGEGSTYPWTAVTPTTIRSMAARTTSCTCRRTSRSRRSGR